MQAKHIQAKAPYKGAFVVFAKPCPAKLFQAYFLLANPNDAKVARTENTPLGRYGYRAVRTVYKGHRLAGRKGYNGVAGRLHHRGARLGCAAEVFTG